MRERVDTSWKSFLWMNFLSVKKGEKILKRRRQVLIASSATSMNNLVMAIFYIIFWSLSSVLTITLMTNQHQDSISIINDQIILVKKDVIISLFQEQKIIIIYVILKFFGSIIDFVCDNPEKLINNLTPLAAHLVSLLMVKWKYGFMKTWCCSLSQFPFSLP